MITLQVGRPGAGKSYEAVVYQIIPALQAGRKVITNIPVRKEALALFDPLWPDLVEVRSYSGRHHFSRVEDYQDDWLRQVPSGNQRALFVIDEAHECLPQRSTDVQVLEWYARHRHAGHDVVLITQDPGKLAKDVRDLAEFTVRTKKFLLFGSKTRYVRQLYDGKDLRRPMSVQTRKYDVRYFSLYQSFTAGGGAFDVKIKPVWLSWKTYAMAGAVALALGYVAKNGVTLFPGVKFDEQKTVASNSVESVRPEISAAIPQPSRPAEMVQPVSLPMPAMPVPQFALPIGYVWLEAAFQMGGEWRGWFRTDGARYREYELEALGALVDLRGVCEATIAIGQAVQRVDCRPSSQFSTARALQDQARDAQRMAQARPVAHADFKPSVASPVASEPVSSPIQQAVNNPASKGSLSRVLPTQSAGVQSQQDWKVQFPN